MQTIPPKTLLRFQELLGYVQKIIKFDSFDYDSDFTDSEVIDIQRFRLERIQHLTYQMYCELSSYLKN